VRISKSVQNSLWVIFANGLSSVFSWLLISIMAKQYDLDSLGIYSYAVALILPIITFAGLNLRAIQLTDVDNKYTLGDFFTIRVIGSLITAIVVIIISFLKGLDLFSMIIVILVLLSRIFDLLSETAQNKFIRDGSYRKYGLSIIIRAVISVIVFMITSAITKNLITSLAAYTLTWGIVFLAFDCKYINIKGVLNGYKPNLSTMIQLTLSCLPLAFVASINVLYDSLPKYFVEHYMTLEDLGVFSAISYVSLIGGLFVTGITVTFSTKLAQINKSGEIGKFIKIILVQEALVVFACVALLTAFYISGEKILQILYSKEFIHYIDVVMWLIAAMSFNFTSRVLGTACTSAQKNKEQLLTASICIITLAISCYFLIPTYNLIGAAISLMLAYVIKNILLIVVLLRWFLERRSVTVEFSN
jgi:O-antigen/teichoic acid export membrane protein